MNLDSLPLCSGRIEAGRHHHLGLEGRLRPNLVELTRSDLFGEAAEEIDLLRTGVTVAGLGYGKPPWMRLHAEVTALDEETRVLNLEGQFRPRTGQYEIRDVQVAERAAELDPLLGFREE